MTCSRNNRIRWAAFLVISAFASLLSAGVSLAQAQEPEHLLLIFAGQSNMEGKGTANTASKLTEKEKATIPNVKGFYCNALLDKGKADPWGLKLYDQKGKFWFNWATWKDATYPAVNGTWQDYAYWRDNWRGAHDYEHGPIGEFWYLGLNPGEPWSNAARFTSGEDVKEFGPEFEVARTVAAAHPKATIYIVKYAPGGTALADQWDLNNTWKGYGAYAAMKQWVDCALAAAPKAKVAGFFWLQGESDAVKGGYAKDYESNLTELVAKVRKDFNAPKLPVVIAKIHPGHTDRNYGTVWSGGMKGIDTVRAAQAKVAAAVGNADVVETSDLQLLTKEWNQKKGKDRKTFNDAVLVDLMEKDKYLAPVHFDADGIRTIGKRMGAAWLILHGKDTPPKKVGGNVRPARAFYFSAKGNDDADGTTPDRAWRSFDKLRGVELVAGDEIVLAEGEEFTGGITLLPDVSGTTAKPIVIRGGGKRRATISADDSPAIEATSGGIEIRDLILKGNQVVPEGKKPVPGIRFYTDDATGKRHSHIRIERVEVSNFSGDGVSIGSWHDKQPGYDDVIVSEVNAHDNGATGITLFGKRDPEQKTYPHRRVTIRDCVASRNKSGSGVVLGGVQNGTVEYCFAAENTGKGGGVALWAYDCNKVTFRHCIACGTRTEGKDGGGFDLDGGCLECVVEHCLSYENHGPGYMHCDYPKAGVTKGNVIRSCISINDGRREKGAAFGFGFVAWGAGLDECTVEKCLAVVSEPAAKQSTEGLLFVSLITGFADKADKTHIRGCGFRNNIAFNTAKDVPLVSNNLPNATLEDVRFEGNSYLTDKTEPIFNHGDKRYSSTDDWRKATAQETRDGKSAVGKTTAESLAVPRDYRLTDPRALEKQSLWKALHKIAETTPRSGRHWLLAMGRRAVSSQYRESEIRSVLVQRRSASQGRRTAGVDDRPNGDDDQGRRGPVAREDHRHTGHEAVRGALAGERVVAGDRQFIPTDAEIHHETQPISLGVASDHPVDRLHVQSALGCRKAAGPAAGATQRDPPARGRRPGGARRGHRQGEGDEAQRQRNRARRGGAALPLRTHGRRPADQRVHVADQGGQRDQLPC